MKSLFFLFFKNRNSLMASCGLMKSEGIIDVYSFSKVYGPT